MSINQDSICLKCRQPFDINTLEGDIQAVEGQYLVCLHCTSIACFNADLDLSPLSENDLKTLKSEEPEVYFPLIKYWNTIKYFSSLTKLIK